MKKVLLLFIAVFISCETPSDNEGNLSNKSETVESETKTFSVPETDADKVNALSVAYTKKGDEYYPNIPTILIEAEKIFTEIGMAGKKISEIPENIKDLVVTNVFAQINKQIPKYTVLKNEKYADCTNDLTYDGIEKGDIILSITHNAILMAIDGENAVHHATLCVKTPESNADTAFISIAGDGETVSHFSLNDIRENDDAAFVLRCKNITAAQINTIAEFAESRIGKPILRCIHFQLC